MYLIPRPVHCPVIRVMSVIVYCSMLLLLLLLLYSVRLSDSYCVVFIMTLSKPTNIIQVTGLTEKFTVIQEIEKGPKKFEIAKEFGIASYTISMYLKNKE